MDKILPQHVNTVLTTLEEAGYEAFVVGGAVRDMIMGLKPKDYDVATNARPEQVMELFEKTIPTGIKHGTVTVVLPNVVSDALSWGTDWGVEAVPVEHSVEITTYRVDGEYSDSRRPDSVEFVSNVELDLARRDLTINAMAMDVRGNIVDPCGGKNDLMNGVIRSVGNPIKRFEEDALRMMRAVRFYSQFSNSGFTIEAETLDAIAFMSHKLEGVSMERIRDEFNKIIMTDRPSRGIRILASHGLLHRFLPELADCVGFDQKNPYHVYDVFGHIMEVLDSTVCASKYLFTEGAVVEPPLSTRLGALFHDIAKPRTFSIDENGVGHFYGHDREGVEMVDEIMKRMKYDSLTTSTVKVLVGEHMNRHKSPTKTVVKRQLARVGCQDLMRELFRVQWSDIQGHASTEGMKGYVRGLLDTAVLLKQIVEEGDAVTVKALAINGNDLKEIGVPPSKLMGEILDKLLNLVIDEKVSNTKVDLIRTVKMFVVKPSGKPFKSGERINTVKGVIDHPILMHEKAYTFYEDDSCVEVRRCELVVKEGE